MKTKHILAVASSFLLILNSCKKDKEPTPPGNTNSEQLGPQAGKIAHYSFNGSLSDGSGNGLNAADSFNITYTADRFGRASQAVVFGGPSNPSWILTPSLGSKIPGFPMSVSFWFKPANVSGGQVIIKSDGFERSATSGFLVSFGFRPGQIGFVSGDKTLGGSTGTNYVVSPQNVITNNTWQHIVFCARGANDYDLYINGVKIQNCTYGGAATSMVFYPEPVRGIIGHGDDYPSYAYYEGAMDDYRIFTKVLSHQEVTALYTFHP